MNTALVISLGAVAISVFVVFIAQRSAKSSRKSNADSSSASGSSDSGNADCGPADGGACDGGGGGGD